MTTRRIATSVLLAALAAGIVGAGCGGGGVGGRDIDVEGPVRITREFVEGKTFKYKFKAESESGVKRTAYEQSIATQTELKTTNTITEVTDESVQMKMHFDYAVGAITVSDRMQPDEAVSALRGKELIFDVTPDGDVLGWTGLSGEESLEAGAGQMAMLLYDILPPLPDEDVTVGTTWTVDYEIPDITANVDRDFIGETTYTVTGFKTKYDIRCVAVDRVTTFEFEGRAEQGGEVWLMSGEGEITGELIVAIDDGHVVHSTSEAELTLTGEGASVAGAAASGVVEMGIRTRLVVEML
jgi:hypothetical protein